MPFGYLWTVAVAFWGVVCALTRWPRLGSFCALPALVVSEMPFIVGYLLTASTVLALAEGDLDSPGGAVCAAVALLALAGLVVIVRDALRAHTVLHNAGCSRTRQSMTRWPTYAVPLPGSVRTPRSMAPTPARCSSPAVRPGANLAIRAVCEGETGIAGLICRYGYYGGLAPRGDLPPMLVVHGEKDIRPPAATARAFAEQARAVSSHPVSYAELPGAHHGFDMYESIRSAAVSTAVEQFTARVSASPT